MPVSPPSICLVTAGHIASTPRLVKEADALQSAGYAVRVVASDHFGPVRPLDAAVLATARWRHERIGLGSPPVYVARRFARNLARRALRRQARPTARLAQWALVPDAAALARAASREPADLYLGHGVGGLVAAGLAAAFRGARLGFDAEDFHRLELSDTPQRAVVALEDRWLPRCAHLTAASPLIATAYADTYGRRAPVVVLNVFPLAEGPGTPSPAARAGGVPTLYWFSQTIGPGRGLEAIVNAIGRSGGALHLHLRGIPANGFRESLAAMARRHGCPNALHWHDSAPPREMAPLASRHDIGLATELSTPPNRALCLTNKIFTYLLAGTPVLLSDTPAHRAFAPELAGAAAIARLESSEELAAAFQRLLEPAARAAAWRLGRDRFNWEREQATFLAAIGAALSPPPGTR